jgi:ABC-type sugar transport system substrate-binding protein
VVANWKPPGKMSVVCIDDVEAAAVMTRHIISLGHRQIGFVIGNPEQKASEQRLTGFRQAMDEAGLAVNPDYVVPGLFTYRSGLEAAERLLNLPDPPTAIFASNDDMAAAAVTVAHRRHLEVPRDVTICGFDDTDFAQSIWLKSLSIRSATNGQADQSNAKIGCSTLPSFAVNRTRRLRVNSIRVPSGIRSDNRPGKQEARIFGSKYPAIGIFEKHRLCAVVRAECEAIVWPISVDAQS